MSAIAEHTALEVAAADWSRPLRIALVSPYDFAYPGGVTNHITGLSDELRRRGHDVTIVAPSSKPRDDVDADNLAIIGRPIPVPTAGSIARVTVSLTLGKRVKPLLEQGNFDIVHLHEPMTPTLPLTFLRLASGPAMVGTFHAYAERRRALGMSRPLLQRWVQRLDERIAVTEPARQFADRYFPRRLHYHPERSGHGGILRRNAVPHVPGRQAQHPLPGTDGEAKGVPTHAPRLRAGAMAVPKLPPARRWAREHGQGERARHRGAGDWRTFTLSATPPMKTCHATIGRRTSSAAPRSAMKAWASCSSRQWPPAGPSSPLTSRDTAR